MGLSADGDLAPELADVLTQIHGALAESYDDPTVTTADMDAVLSKLSSASGQRFVAVWCHLKDGVACGGWYLAAADGDGWRTASGALLDHLAGSAEADALAHAVDTDGTGVLVGGRLLDLTSLAIAEGIRVNASNIALTVYRPVGVLPAT